MLECLLGWTNHPQLLSPVSLSIPPPNLFAPNMENMRKRINTESDIDIFSYGCQAHVVHLAAKTLKEKHQQVAEKIIVVLKGFRNVHALNALRIASCEATSTSF